MHPAGLDRADQRGVDLAGAGQFWADFAERYYGREPFEADDPPDDLAVDSAEFFALLTRAASRHGNGPRDPRLRFHLGQRQVIADLADYLPAPGDGSLEGYLARLHDQIGDQPYLLVVERAQVLSRPVWARAARLMAAVQAATGVLLPGNVELEVFLGRYPHTIPGIHRERSGVFVSMIRGSKDMLVWPPDQTGLPVGSAHYQQASATARRLRCAPGRLVYWPAMHWHVGESPAQTTAGLHLAVLEQPPSVRDLIAAPTSDLDEPIAAGSGPGWSGLSCHELELPSGLAAAADAVVAAYGDPARVRDLVSANWLRRRTGLGFTVLPPVRRAKIALDSQISRASVLEIILAERDSGTCWIAADGRVGYARSSPALSQLIDRLNSGEQLTVGTAISPAGAAAERAVLLKVVELLAGWRALDVARAPRPAAGQARSG